MLAVAIIALLIGCAYFGLELITIPLAAVWATISGVMLLTMLMLIQLFASSARGADILSLAIILPLMMVGGSFFPFEAMPRWMAAIGTQTPNGWAL
ncbi:MAG: hypothetical protein GTO51_06460 [Candidatus Latescibacteria bacterium]|nr:hypothetical protein [Candidatus Latescibacterota bacterium]NIM21434.1 hypothetical protein [Candidatus Latescibacterota bacterium]NIM65615.1 hypothetical protein [Candidatus Latescibacterota bacterium]NIO01995.1 hypothetical protein [Candidatus Latescibacterota bacterium]NIO28807.1 hypothetical protein [Candidatus Latescibacterota bacterium]